MILKKKNLDFSLKKYKKYLTNLILIIGLVTSVFIFIILTYYYSSGLSKRYPFFSLIKEIDRVILQKYVGFSLYEIDDYLKTKFNLVKHFVVKNNLENLNLIIDQENLYNLEMQRQKKLGNIKYYETNSDNNMARAKMTFNDEIFKIKLRVKGDRLIHWYNKNETSYKIDIIGDNRFMGLEEFSIQKPITRNYIYEYIFHKLLEKQNLISLKYSFVNLKINNSEKGIFAIEEGFSKELIERNKRRNGPIFGIDEVISDSSKGIVYPSVLYDLYSSNYWLSNYPKLIENAFIKLNSLKEKKIEVSEIFDLKKWAKYFAIIELTNGWHGALSKSVKLYYNTVTGKFEPIGFDAHIIPNYENKFILLDSLNEKNCIAGCHDRKWFLTFILKNDGSLNKKFLDLYIQELNKVTSDIYINEFFKEYEKEINYYNSQLNTENFKKDVVGMYKGLGNYKYDNKFLLRRISYLNKRIKDIDLIGNLQIKNKENLIYFKNLSRFFFKRIVEKCDINKKKSFYITNNVSINYSDNCEYFIGDTKIKFNNNVNISSNLKSIKIKKYSNLLETEKLESKNDVFFLKKNLIIDKNYIIPKDKTLIVNKGVEINFLNDYILKSYGSIEFQGTIDEPIKINNIGKMGSFILLDNKYIFKNTSINKLSNPKDENRILHGGINIINSQVEILNVEIKNSKSEDAINFISSDVFIKDLKIDEIQSDGVDVDFGNLIFENIYCTNIKNDCLDLSNSTFKGKNLNAKNVNDKGLSVGENSRGYIENLFFEKNRLAIAVKDGSNLSISKLDFLDNQFDVAVFKKKKEYESASLKIDNISDHKISKIYLGKKNFISSNHNLRINNVKNSYLNNIFY